VIVTGASDGIGAAAAVELARHGDHVVIVGRSPEKTQAVAQRVKAAAGEPVEMHCADFARLEQVRALGATLAAAHPRIDVLVDNAGQSTAGERTVTEDGYELTFQVNHLGPFLLTHLLRASLVSAAGRVIVTSSSAGTAPQATLDLEDLNSERSYRPFTAYARSKLANVLFASELAARWAVDGVSAASFHPGLVRTNFFEGGNLPTRLVTRSPLRLLLRSPEHGADTLVWLATSVPGADWVSGGYYSDRRPARPHAQAGDPDVAARLWELSADLVGVPA
jgi:NAD(P)-dependent dehydrogenase (short-subunit alcohol dehydrogenase family)